VSDEHWEAIKKLLRAYARLRIENNLLGNMLSIAQLRQKAPRDWFAEIRALRELPENQQPLRVLEEELEHADQERVETKLLAILESYLPPPDQIQ
jgi:hypothetical protein